MIARFLPLCISTAFAVAIVVLIMTPLAWNLMGRPDETYPEPFFLLFGAPPAFILVTASTVIALLGGQKLGGPLRPALRPLWICMAATVTLATLILTRLYLFPGGAGEFDLTPYAAWWLVLFLWMIAATAWAWIRTRAAARA